MDAAPVRYCRDMISEIIEQIKAPKTGAPHNEIPELVAELVLWMGNLREVEKVAEDWLAV